jgi:hypothetical protein
MSQTATKFTQRLDLTVWVTGRSRGDFAADVIADTFEILPEAFVQTVRSRFGTAKIEYTVTVGDDLDAQPSHKRLTKAEKG